MIEKRVEFAADFVVGDEGKAGGALVLRQRAQCREELFDFTPLLAGHVSEKCSRSVARASWPAMPRFFGAFLA